MGESLFSYTSEEYPRNSCAYKLDLYNNHLPVLLTHFLPFVDFEFKMLFLAFVPVISSLGTDHPGGENNVSYPKGQSPFLSFQ